MKITHATMCLGKCAPRHDPRTLKLATYLPKLLPPAPRSRNWTKKVHDWPMMANNRIGDCVVAGAGHQVQLWTANDGPKEVIIPDKEIIAAYSAVGGYDPKTGRNDNGLVMLDFLKYWRNVGLAGHKIGAFAQVDVRNLAHLKFCNDAFGGVYVGIALPVTAQRQIIWDVIKTRGDGRPGSWGGHCVLIAQDTGSLWRNITWGAKKGMTYKFFSAYGDEAWAVISEEWLGADDKTPSGFNKAALLEDLKAFR